MPIVNGSAPTKKPVRLLKRVNVVEKDGIKHVYSNLYIQLGSGLPIAIQLPAKIFNPKVKNLLLANAEEYETAIIIKNNEE